MIGFGVIWGCFEVFLGGVLGGSGGVKECVLDHYRTLFAPLEVLFGTRFSSKHHIMVKMANIHWVGITGPFLDLLGPFYGLPNSHFFRKYIPSVFSNSPKPGLLASGKVIRWPEKPDII